MGLSEHLGILTSGQSENMREELEFQVQELETVILPSHDSEKEILMTCMDQAIKLLENPLKGIFKQLFSLTNSLLTKNTKQFSHHKQSNTHVHNSNRR